MARESNSHTVSIVSSSSALGALANSMSSNSWADFSMGGLTLGLVDAGGGHSIVEFCARGHWDRLNKKIQFWGQGHNTAEKLITWDDATNQWSVGTPPAFGGIGHAYYHLAMNQATGDLYLRQYSGAGIKRKLYNASWSNVASINNSYNQVAGGLEWFPALNSGAGGLVFCDTASAESSTATVSGWTVRNGSLSPVLGPYHQWIAATTSFCYFGGGNGSSAMFRMNASGAVAVQPSTPAQAGIWAEAGASPVISHPNGTDILQLGSDPNGGTISRFNGTSWSSVGTMQIGTGLDQWFAVPIDTYGVVLFVAAADNVSTPICRVYKV